MFDVLLNQFCWWYKFLIVNETLIMLFPSRRDMSHKLGYLVGNTNITRDILFGGIACSDPKLFQLWMTIVHLLTLTPIRCWLLAFTYNRTIILFPKCKLC